VLSLCTFVVFDDLVRLGCMTRSVWGVVNKFGLRSVRRQGMVIVVKFERCSFNENVTGKAREARVT